MSEKERRKDRCLAAIQIMVGLLVAKVFLGVLYHYRGYFPPNFESDFLAGRRFTFTGIYPSAFYAHIVSGPICFVLAAFQLWSGPQGQLARCRAMHRVVGKSLAVLVVLVMLPSGMVMAGRAYGGPISATGFGALTIATAICIILAAWTARLGNIPSHRRWAQRCFVLLVSPLILRLVSGVLITFDFESERTYQLNAWASWLIPLAILELCRYPNAIGTHKGNVSCMFNETRV